MAPSSSFPPSASVDFSLYHILFSAVVVTTALFGIIVMQAFMYFTIFKNEKPWMKSIVALLVVLVGTSIVFQCIPLQVSVVQSHGNFDTIATSWGLSPVPVLTATVASTVQLVFGWRIKALTENVRIFGVIVFLSTCQWLAGLTVTVSQRMLLISPQSLVLENVAITWSVLAATTDIVISAALIAFLVRNRTGVKTVDSTVNKIIRLTIQTGLLTSIAALFVLELYVAYPQNG
ncbi:hypothetical protein PLICRDRAFT_166912 [Plicaturopsis crispa FD-325 SS-3]|uniref:Unplaced genomic scaffold PLICRscaffold_15, whole genome shotgun sequence n=1 Tax=Plicaturopsis crispa FD-325 SS-3 TaxID=944288 RepID=A0A0C9SLC6_PLICR|nr:hypothetical protein PLICRDRAFT_166912 [Plicaturopsis crispa FD-325 SS-3]